MNKILTIFLIIIFCISLILVGFFNYPQIVEYLKDDTWQLATLENEIHFEDISMAYGNTNLLVLTKDKIRMFDNNIELSFETPCVNSSTYQSSNGDYTALFITELNEFFLFKNSKLIWNKKLNLSILELSVNSNGYVSIVFSQSGYKSGVKVFLPNGDELFTNSLANSYANKTIVTQDNKYLYIAETYIDGIKLYSQIRRIDISDVKVNQEDEKLNSISFIKLADNEVVLDFSTNNEILYILTNESLYQYEIEEGLKKIKYIDNNVSFVTINSGRFPIIIGQDLNLRIMKDEMVLVKLDAMPQSIKTLNNRIVLCYGDKILSYDMNGRKVAKYSFTNQLKDFNIFNKGNKIALVFRDRIELINI